MPIYTYQCQKCGYSFDDMRSMADMDAPVGQPCPDCKKPAIQRVMQASNFHLKGSGWYKQVKQ